MAARLALLKAGAPRPRSLWARMSLAAAVLALAPGPAPADQAPDEAIARIDSVMRAAAERGLNGVLLIRAGAAPLLHEAYGWADREARVPMSVSTGFDIGSLVKPITATTILKLEESGMLSTDDTLGHFFPDAPRDKAGITVMQILTHTSGMRDMFGGDYQVVTRDWVLERAMNASLLGPPGERERYSNSGYSLLAMIIEDVTGTSFEACVREAVLEPAGTPGIGYTLAGWENARLAVGYQDGRRWGTPLDKAWAHDGPGWNLRGNGGMLATAEEMARWYKALFDGKVLGPAALEKYYAFDAGESSSAGGRALGHAGGNGVFNTLQISWIDHDVHFTLFTSTSRPLNAESVWDEISDDVIAIARAAAEGN